MPATWPAGGLAEAAEAQERGFAAAVAPDQAQAFAAFEVEGDVLECPELVRPQGGEVGGRWSVVGGQWSVVRGRWSVVGGRWPVVRGRWSVVGGLTTVYRQLTTVHRQPTTGHASDQIPGEILDSVPHGAAQVAAEFFGDVVDAEDDVVGEIGCGVMDHGVFFELRIMRMGGVSVLSKCIE